MQIIRVNKTEADVDIVIVCFTCQMLSMRSGLSLRPMCLPGVLQPLQLSQMRKSFGEGNTSFHMNMSGTLSMNHETTMQNAYSLPNNQCSLSNLPSISNTAQIINPETSFGLESSIYAHLESSQLHTSSEVSFMRGPSR